MNNSIVRSDISHVRLAPITESGNDISNFDYAKNFFDGSHIGVDETGSQDFFGPLCVVSCFVDERDFDWLLSIGVKDPKELTNKEVVAIAKEIKDRLIYSLLILDNSHYNQLAQEGNNLANIKAKLYNQAVTNVMQKVQLAVDYKCATQFVSPKTYFNYLKTEVIVVKDLEFVPKGEEKYLGIMCSAILSRYACLQYFQNMSKTLKMKLPRGTSPSVETVALEVANKYGKKMLFKVTKTNMTNYKRLKNTMEKAV